MYKKAGIIVGLILIIAAVAIFLIATSARGNDKDNKTQETKATQGTTAVVVETATPITQPISTQAAEIVTQAPATAPVVVAPGTELAQTTTQPIAIVPPETTSFNAEDFTTTTEQTTAPVAAGNNLIELDVNSLPAYVDTTDIGTIIGHKVYAYNGQVLYSLLINTTTSGQLEFFTTKTNFDIADNTHVNITIRYYTAQSGNFPSIVSISAA